MQNNQRGFLNTVYIHVIHFSTHTCILNYHILYRVFQKSSPAKTFWHIFTSVKSLREILQIFWQFISTYICQCLYIYLNISSNGVNFSTSTHRLSRSIHPENKHAAFQKWYHFSSSRVSVSDNCKQLTTVWFFLLLTFYWHCFKAR